LNGKTICDTEESLPTVDSTNHCNTSPGLLVTNSDDFPASEYLDLDCIHQFEPRVRIRLDPGIFVSKILMRLSKETGAKCQYFMISPKSELMILAFEINPDISVFRLKPVRILAFYVTSNTL